LYNIASGLKAVYTAFKKMWARHPWVLGCGTTAQFLKPLNI